MHHIKASTYKPFHFHNTLFDTKPKHLLLNFETQRNLILNHYHILSMVQDSLFFVLDYTKYFHFLHVYPEKESRLRLILARMFNFFLFVTFLLWIVMRKYWIFCFWCCNLLILFDIIQFIIDVSTILVTTLSSEDSYDYVFGGPLETPALSSTIKLTSPPVRLRSDGKTEDDVLRLNKLILFFTFVSTYYSIIP